MIAVLLWLFAASGAQAYVASVTGTATPGTVSYNQASSVTITWRLSLRGGSTIISPSGTFLGPGVIGTNNKSIAQAPSFIVNPNIVTEVLLVPSNVTYAANKNGQTQITYKRQFSNGSGAPVTGTVTLDIGGSAGTGFLNLSRVELKFDTNEIVHVAAREETLRAVAEINYSGSGLLDAIWEVADPASTLGTPVFFPLRTIRQYLGAGRTAILQSPPLPTTIPGNHIVQLKIRRPTVAYELPALQYNVNAALNSISPGNLQVITLQAPGPFALLREDTEFRWQEIPGARAYQLEIYIPGNQDSRDIPPESLETQTGSTAPRTGTPPVTGILIPADRTYAQLSMPSLKYLDPARPYLWRVIAIGENGSVLGVSELQELRTP